MLKFKKLSALIIAAVLSLSAAGCGSTNSADEAPSVKEAAEETETNEAVSEGSLVIAEQGIF
ncbi:MAG: hypothetical protein LUD81_11810, partial [Clostridiales bacterium]|nr:hypothetical protein [Clostridiales bacterium]